MSTITVAEGQRGEEASALGEATLCAAFQRTAAMRPEAPALRTEGDQVPITWAGYAERVRAIAGGLHALGLRRGDTLALLLTNRPEFNLVDAAALHLGAIPFSIYTTCSPEQVAFQLRDAGARIAVTERAGTRPPARSASSLRRRGSRTVSARTGIPPGRRSDPPEIPSTRRPAGLCRVAPPTDEQLHELDGQGLALRTVRMWPPTV
jgi:acyl-CoA synthetase (AMP-forming)/AMP-acid ligase II